MLSSKIKDLKNRRKFCNTEKLQRIDKFIFVNTLSNKGDQDIERLWTAFRSVDSFNKKNSKVRITRRCVINNRSRSVVRPFGISRIHLRELLQFGLVPGYSKAVW